MYRRPPRCGRKRLIWKHHFPACKNILRQFSATAIVLKRLTMMRGGKKVVLLIHLKHSANTSAKSVMHLSVSTGRTEFRRLLLKKKKKITKMQLPLTDFPVSCCSVQCAFVKHFSWCKKILIYRRNVYLQCACGSTTLS